MPSAPETIPAIVRLAGTPSLALMLALRIVPCRVAQPACRVGVVGIVHERTDRSSLHLLLWRSAAARVSRPPGHVGR
jgi:hypothetical protein